ncbi:glycerol-3-phosphate acyltransferase [Virgibacillus flavescens]|uniref:glycerol-3-phosphate acyltransferase n=1 Tax=Virgibacillus flavescens TaxID=1611422 RepID=UPI003D32C401
MYYVISMIVGYLVGCMHGSQLVGKYKKVDMKKTGVKNSGASNTTIVLGWKYGCVVALIDIFKATFSVLLLLNILNQSGMTEEVKTVLVYLNVFFVIIGHNFPITMNFNGGKGTASIVGAFLAIDWKVAVICISVLVLVTLTTDYLAVGVLFMYISFVALSFYYFGVSPGIIALLLFAVSLMKHQENYKRVLAKEETKLSSLFGKKTV